MNLICLCGSIISVKAVKILTAAWGRHVASIAGDCVPYTTDRHLGFVVLFAEGDTPPDNASIRLTEDCIVQLKSFSYKEMGKWQFGGVRRTVKVPEGAWEMAPSDD